MQPAQRVIRVDEIDSGAGKDGGKGKGKGKA